jgi:transposase InsO family protein
MAFLRNHREAIVAMDFFTVPTATFSLLYCCFIIGHDRRRILHCNVTRHPRSTWIAKQLREAFPYESAPKFLILDHDAKYGREVPAAIRSMKIIPTRTSIRSPWQNGVAERWVGSCRRELLDYVIALNERHLRRLLDVSYYHDDRTRLGLEKQTPSGRTRSAAHGQVSGRNAASQRGPRSRFGCANTLARDGGEPGAAPEGGRERKAMKQFEELPAGRPSKRDRRKIIQFRGRA